jgi:putative transposase
MHNRRSIRLHDWDYSRSSAYFVTICVEKRECLLGGIVDGKMVLNDAGNMVEKWYMKLAAKYFNINCDEHIVMPNHFHAIITIVSTPAVGADPRVCPNLVGNHTKKGEHMGSPLRKSKIIGQKPANVSEIIQWFKTMTTNEYIRNVKKDGWPSFSGKLWQRNYYDHIIRDEKSLYQIRHYIRNNPAGWETDEENPITASPRYVAMPDAQKRVIVV